MRWWRFSQLIWALARSPSARDQLKHILARPPLPSPPEPPAGFIDVRSIRVFGGFMAIHVAQKN